MVLKPGREDFAEAIFRKWELDFAVIGEVTDTGRMMLEHHGEVVADIPLGPLADDAPLYDRPAMSREDYKVWAQVKPLGDIPESTDIGADLLKLMASPDIASRRWIWEQYDQKVGGNTVQPPGGDAAVVRIHGTDKALAITTDCTPRYCYADPYEGGKQAIAETYRNLCAVGATPLAVTNCLNFGNPQRPEIMAQFKGCLEGMADACRALDFPIVSGNVSLYNESRATGGGSAILPTPAIGGVGLLQDSRRSATIAFKAAGEAIILLGVQSGASDKYWRAKAIAPEIAPTAADWRLHHATGMFARWGGHMGQSLWLREVCGREDGPSPPTNLEHEKQLGILVRRLIADGKISAAHDVSDGGIAVALAEMSLAGGIGASVQTYGDELVDYFCEDQGRFLVTAPFLGDEDWSPFFDVVSGAGLEADWIGTTGGDRFILLGEQEQVEADIPLADLRAAHEGFFPALMDT